MQVGPGGSVYSCHMDPCQTKFQPACLRASVVLELARFDVSLELLGLEGGDIINGKIPNEGTPTFHPPRRRPFKKTNLFL